MLLSQALEEAQALLEQMNAESEAQAADLQVRQILRMALGLPLSYRQVLYIVDGSFSHIGTEATMLCSERNEGICSCICDMRCAEIPSSDTHELPARGKSRS